MPGKASPKKEDFSELEQLREQLLSCQSEAEANLEGWQRAKADYSNYKTEASTLLASAKSHSEVDLVSELLPTLDSFNMAFANKEAWQSVDENWRTGVEYIYQQLKTVLETRGLKEVGKVGETFDPNLHHSVEQVEVTDQSQDHLIQEVSQVGYSLKDKVLRAAQVKVGSFNSH